MRAATANSYFFRGLRDSFPFVFVAGPFGLLFGVLASEAGLKLHEVMAFTVSVFAGAAQFTALQLLREDAPTVIVLVSALILSLIVFLMDFIFGVQNMNETSFWKGMLGFIYKLIGA